MTQADAVVTVLLAAVDRAPTGTWRDALLGRIQKIQETFGIFPDPLSDEWADLVSPSGQTRPSWQDADIFPRDDAPAAGEPSDIERLEEIMAEDAGGGAG